MADGKEDLFGVFTKTFNQAGGALDEFVGNAQKALNEEGERLAQIVKKNQEIAEQNQQKRSRLQTPVDQRIKSLGDLVERELEKNRNNRAVEDQLSRTNSSSSVNSSRASSESVGSQESNRVVIDLTKPREREAPFDSPPETNKSGQKENNKAPTAQTPSCEPSRATRFILSCSSCLSNFKKSFVEGFKFYSKNQPNETQKSNNYQSPRNKSPEQKPQKEESFFATLKRRAAGIVNSKFNAEIGLEINSNGSTTEYTVPVQLRLPTPYNRFEVERGVQNAANKIVNSAGTLKDRAKGLAKAGFKNGVGAIQFATEGLTRENATSNVGELVSGLAKFASSKSETTTLEDSKVFAKAALSATASMMPTPSGMTKLAQSARAMSGVKLSDVKEYAGSFQPPSLPNMSVKGIFRSN